ncbi:MAG TPA: cyclic nucleotide-binding domain-containing protein [Nitrososphaerales archaeon]|nr:cyclic nucleotide-binding domain-containing protein [Nitrososphaerales archaeon]
MPTSENDAKGSISLLEHVPLFSSLKKPHLKKLVEASTIRSFDAGEFITKQGDAGVAFYLILEGQVEVRRSNRSLAKLGEGQFFGELTLIDNHPRTADVVAIDRSKCLLLSSWTFHGLVKANPDIALALLKEMAQRLRKTDEALSDL